MKISMKIQKDGVLIGKPYIEVVSNEEPDIEKTLDEINKHNCSFVEFAGKVYGCDKTRQLVGKLKDEGKFVTLVSLGTKITDIEWDYVTLWPMVLPPNHEVLDKYFKLKTKIQVKIKVEKKDELRDIGKFLRRHYLLKKRRIPVVFLTKEDTIADAIMEKFTEYNFRIM